MDYKLSRGRRLVQAVHDANGNNERNENTSAKENINDYQKCIPEVQQTLPVIVLTEDSCITDYVSLNSFNMEEAHLPSTDHIIPRCVPSSEQEVLPIQLEFAHDTNSESSREQIIYLEKTINDSQEPITLTNTHDHERLLSSSILENESDKFIDPNNHNMNEGRKRRKKADPSQWKRNINKKLRMEGKAYLGFRKAGSTVIQDIPRDERKIKPTCMSTVYANSKKRNCQYFTQEHYEAGNLQEESWKEHIEKKEKASKEKREDKEKANIGKIILIEVDFQAAKLAPFTHANAFYYKTKLACHNFTIYDIMEVDSVHACIERKLKKKEIKLPSDYVSITREAREKLTPHEAIDLTYDFFRDYTKPLRYNSIRPGRMKHDPTVTDIKVISYHPSGIIKVKLDFSEELKDLPQRPKRFDPVQS
ncbi:unnamed protein product [Diatraea saccharalis]|uniref:Uncharacterized protein n=1 Tax=Diatraea saccharalis TaxID=40085 RepID=A0A9N9QZ37_9NEOP|nr:unnamed protein product [Diatraea saccharalis]